MKTNSLIPAFRALQLMFVFQAIFVCCFVPTGEMWYNIVAELCYLVIIGFIIAVIDVYVFELKEKQNGK